MDAAFDLSEGGVGDWVAKFATSLRQLVVGEPFAGSEVREFGSAEREASGPWHALKVALSSAICKRHLALTGVMF